MTPEVAVDLFRGGLWMTAMIVGVLVVPSLLVGLLVMLLTLIWAGPWLVRELMEYTQGLIQNIPLIIG